MSSTALVFMIAAWGIIMAAVAISLRALLKSGK